MRNAFYSYHPVVNLFYFVLVLTFSMVLMHPACLVISLVCACAYAVSLSGRRALRFGMVFMLLVLLLTAIINPAFNHAGATILAYLPSGNPLTLESLVYGLVAGMMLAAVVGWFSCFSAVMTSDKFVYLFGRVAPALSLILSMSLRFVPRFRAQLRAVADAQRCIGRDMSDGSVLQRVRQGVHMLSILITWALENAIETADSMKSRGYGLPDRTAFSIFRFGRRDRWVLLFLLAVGGYLTLGTVTGGLYMRYFPTVRGAAATPYFVSLLAAYGALCLMPLILNVREGLKWKAIQSNI